jgi:hypothetical protein
MKKTLYMLIAACVTCAIFVPSASAVEWLVKKLPVPAGGIEVNITTKGQSLLLEDSAVGVDLLCEMTGKGLVLLGGEDLEEAAGFPSCVLDSAGSCTKLEAVALVFLPWETSLEAPKVGEWLDRIFKGTGGEPGWLIECNSVLGKIDDTCQSILYKPEAKNLANRTVELTFLANEPLATCLLGGKTGKVEGTIALEALVAGVLEELEIS